MNAESVSRPSMEFHHTRSTVFFPEAVSSRGGGCADSSLIEMATIGLEWVGLRAPPWRVDCDGVSEDALIGVASLHVTWHFPPSRLATIMSNPPRCRGLGEVRVDERIDSFSSGFRGKKYELDDKTQPRARLSGHRYGCRSARDVDDLITLDIFYLIVRISSRFSAGARVSTRSLRVADLLGSAFCGRYRLN